MTVERMAVKGNIKKDAPVNYAFDFRTEIEKRTNGKSVDCTAYFENGAFYIENAAVLPRPYGIKSQSVSSITFYLNSSFAYTEVVEKDADTGEVVSFLLYIPVDNEEAVFAFREMFNDLSIESGCDVNEIIDENPFFVSDDERDDGKTSVPLPTDVVDGANEAMESIKTFRDSFSSEEDRIDSALRVASIPVANEAGSEVEEAEDDGYFIAAFENGPSEAAAAAMPYQGDAPTSDAASGKFQTVAAMPAVSVRADAPEGKPVVDVEVDSEKSAATRDQLIFAMSKSNISDDAKIAGLATKLAHSTEQNKKLKAELQRLSAKHAQLQESVTQIRTLLDDRNRQNDDLQRELRFEREATAKANKFVADARQEMSNVITKSEYNIALANKRAENAEKKSTEHDIARVKAEQALDAANKDYAQKTIELNAKYQEFEDVLKVAEYEKRVASRTVEEVSRKLEEFSAKAISEIGLEHEKVVELESKLDEKETEIANRDEELNILHGKFEGLEQEKTRLEQDFNVSTDKLKEEYEARIDELHKKVIDLEYDNSTLADAHRADEDFRMQFAEEHEGTLARYAADLESKDAELAEIKSLMESDRMHFEQTIASLRSDVAAKNGSIEALEKEKQAILGRMTAEAAKSEAAAPVDKAVFTDDETIGLAGDLMSQHLLIYDFMDKLNEIIKGKGKLKKNETDKIIMATSKLLEQIDDDAYQKASDMIEHFNAVKAERAAAASAGYDIESYPSLFESDAMPAYGADTEFAEESAAVAILAAEEGGTPVAEAIPSDDGIVGEYVPLSASEYATSDSEESPYRAPSIGFEQPVSEEQPEEQRFVEDDGDEYGYEADAAEPESQQTDEDSAEDAAVSDDEYRQSEEYYEILEENLAENRIDSEDVDEVVGEDAENEIADETESTEPGTADAEDDEDEAAFEEAAESPVDFKQTYQEMLEQHNLQNQEQYLPTLMPYMNASADDSDPFAAHNMVNAQEVPEPAAVEEEVWEDTTASDAYQDGISEEETQGTGYDGDYEYDEEEESYYASNPSKWEAADSVTDKTDEDDSDYEYDSDDFAELQMNEFIMADTEYDGEYESAGENGFDDEFAGAYEEIGSEIENSGTDSESEGSEAEDEDETGIQSEEGNQEVFGTYVVSTPTGLTEDGIAQEYHAISAEFSDEPYSQGEGGQPNAVQNGFDGAIDESGAQYGEEMPQIPAEPVKKKGLFNRLFG